ncbi:MAG: SUMF1/EgtB/PvdO family nonheme iron enzyme [Cyanobacteria bacterium J06631_9]
MNAHQHATLTRDPIYLAIQDCRRQTLALIDDLSTKELRSQAHPDFSPIGWHLGHIAYTESLWILEALAGQPNLFPQYARLFAADGLPKAQRQNLPTLADLIAYLSVVREATLTYLKTRDPTQSSEGAEDIEDIEDIENAEDELRLWHWLIQHESQHLETMRMVLALHRLKRKLPGHNSARQSQPAPSKVTLVSAGDFIQGSDAPNAIDNERPAHRVWLNDYWIDSAPVTCLAFQQFIDSGGYETARWWSPEGWRWQQQARVSQPLYWPKTPEAANSQPVCGVSWYEAEAYARFVGKRLPTEAEWEKAANLAFIDTAADQTTADQTTTGHVWEWTASWFEGYPGFRPFPYPGYSQLYFDQKHRVLRGGSRATPHFARRNSFRNWYHPHRRELFAGFRCAVRCAD